MMEQYWTQSQFGNDDGGYDLAVGAVTGIRYWSLDPSGLIKGAFTTWTAGTNTASCRKPAATPAQAAFRRWAAGHGPAVLPDELEPVEVGPGHDAPGETCHCGFYAFWDDQNWTLPVQTDKPVLGVIQGHGKTIIGTLGFRCQKAEILALHVPADTPGWATVPLATVAEIEAAIEERYVVPVYASRKLMLHQHPPSTDYLT